MSELGPPNLYAALELLQAAEHHLSEARKARLLGERTADPAPYEAALVAAQFVHERIGPKIQILVDLHITAEPHPP